MAALRQYQIDFKKNIKLSLHKHKKIIACSATGSGKTKTFLSITQDAVKKKTVLIITESRKIFLQIAAEVDKCTEIAAGVEFVEIQQNGVYVAMAQTLAKRPQIISQLQKLENNLLIINDEAHIGTATKLLLQLPNAYLIGFTATPDYQVAKHLPTLYNNCVVGAQPQELIEMEYLSPYYHFMRKEVDTSGLIKDSKGEYTEDSQYQAFATTKIFAGVFEDLQKYKYTKAIIFCSSIKHCKKLVDQLRDNDIFCAEVHSQNKQADIELHLFHNDKNCNICVSVGVLTKGYDFPTIDLIVLLRATTSLALYCQMIGRGSRLAPNKSRFTVLDYGENGERHQPWNYEHDWQNLWKPQKKKKKKEGEGVAPVKECPKCYLLVPPKTTICPECGYDWPIKEKEQHQGIMIEITEQMNILRGKYIGDLTAQELSNYAKLTNKKAFAIRVAKAHGIEFLKQFATLMGYKPNWVNHQDLSQTIDFYNILIK